MDRQLRALVIDDAELWLNTLSRLLRGQGFEVETAGTYGLAKTWIEASAVQGEPFHLAVVDLLLGDIETYCGAGFALIERLLDLGTAVVINTGYATPKLMDETFKTFGFLGFLEKKKCTDQDLERVTRLVADLPRSTGQPTEYNLAAMRDLIQDAFTANDLWRFCQTRPAFAPTLTHFNRASSLQEMIDALTQYCGTRLLFPDLLAEIQAINPKQYARYRSRLHRDDKGMPGAGRRLSAEARERLEALLREAATGQAAPLVE